MNPSLLTPLAKNHLPPVAQKLDSAICWLNLYLLDSAIGFLNTYPLDSDLSSGCALSSFWATGAWWRRVMNKLEEMGLTWGEAQVKWKLRTGLSGGIWFWPCVPAWIKRVSEWASERAYSCKCLNLFAMTIIDARLLICCLQLILAMCQLVQPVKMLMMMMFQVGATWGCGQEKWKLNHSILVTLGPVALNF